MTTRTSFVQKFLKGTARTWYLFGAADRRRLEDPVLHRNDAFEKASLRDLAGFEVERDREGHRYIYRTRRSDAA